jgi:hypothetical protein
VVLAFEEGGAVPVVAVTPADRDIPCRLEPYAFQSC